MTWCVEKIIFQLKFKTLVDLKVLIKNQPNSRSQDSMSTGTEHTQVIYSVRKQSAETLLPFICKAQQSKLKVLYVNEEQK